MKGGCGWGNIGGRFVTHERDTGVKKTTENVFSISGGIQAPFAYVMEHAISLSASVGY